MATKIDNLFIAVGLDNKEFRTGIAAVNKELELFAKKAGGAPVVAAGALASVLVLVSGAALQMARDVERGVRQATQSMPELVGRIGDINAALKTLALESGRSQAELSRAFAVAANSGVASFEEANAVLRIATRIADATGEDVESIIGGLDLALDRFGISAARAADVGARLFAVSNGRFGFGQLAEALRPVIPLLEDLDAPFEVVIGALATLIDQGNNSRGVARIFTEIANSGAEGRKRLQELAGEIGTAEENFARLNKAVDTARESSDVAAARIREKFRAVMIDLGNRILPVATSALQGFLGVLDALNGNRRRESPFAGLADNLPGDQKGLEAFLAARRKSVLAINDAIKLQQDQIAELEKTGTIAGADPEFDDSGRDRVLRASERIDRRRKEITELIDNITDVNAAASLAAAALKDITDPPDRPGASPPTTTGTDEATKAFKELGATLRTLERDIMDPLRTKFDDLRERIAALAATAGSAQAQGLAKLANQLVTVQEALDGFAPTVRFGADQVEGLAVRFDFDEQFATLRRLQRETDALDDDSTERLAKEVELSIQRGRFLRDAIRGALDLADAFGVVDDALADILSSLGDVATGIGPLISALTTPGIGLGTIIGTALPVVGGISQLVGGLFGGGESAEQRALREAIERNREALEANSRNLAALREEGLLSSGLTGEQIEIGRRVRQFGELDVSLIPPEDASIDFSPDLSQSPFFGVEAARRELDRLGLSLDGLRDLASDLGIEFVDLLPNRVNEFVAFLRSISAVIGQPTFGTGLAGRLEQVRAGFGFTETPVTAGQQFQQLVGAASTGSGFAAILAEAFADVDFSGADTAAGQAQLREIIRGLFARVTAADFDEFAALGDFSGSEFLAFLGDLNRLAQSAGTGTIGEDTIQSVGISRTLSEVTGERMAGLLGSQLVVEQASLDELRAIRSLMTPTAFGTLAPPSLALATTSASAGTTIVSIGTITLSVPSPTTASGTLDLATLAQLISTETARQIALARGGG